VVPATTTAVVVFVLLVTPGIVFELLWQRTRPRRDESTFVEIGRVLLTGVVFSGLATAVVGVLSAFGAAASVVALVSDGPAYVADNPGLVLGSLVTVVLLAICAAVATHDLLTPPTMRRIAQETVWHTAFSRMAEPGVRVYLSVQLKDGTTITGYKAGYSTEPEPAKRDLLLTAPLAIRHAGKPTATRLDESWQSLVVAGGEISTIAAAYEAPATAVPASRTNLPSRAVSWLTRHSGLAALAGAAVVLVAQLVVGMVL
jgi:Family of unknown function (DUF6338)